ncbi:MerR family transcriptional regulator [Actinomarinicola tropica]|uniref:MerR family transcriptional regulator n=1 Tax=Actinomarinicola tropica TaxID=2789776 RepID=A0A5Q2RQE4_9ACTN|nr:MerR family transcriptional regulator [Actinomarinicola tropica]QGG96781.1 MerR family transcriptional regulator [Actinomarinicola tropica]
MADRRGRLTIGELAAVSGIPTTSLRFYERRGLLPAPERVGGKRRYDPTIVMRLMVIRFCRVAGLPLDEIAQVLDDESPGRAATKDIAERRIAEIDRHVAELQLARRMMVAAHACTCPSVEVCGCGAMAPVIEEVRALRSSGTAPGTTTDGRPAPPRRPT